MKKILLFIVIALFLLFAFSCTKEGQVVGRSTQHIKINGTEYYFLKVVPRDGHDGVWLLIPKDVEVEVPQVIAYTVRCGKHCHRIEEVIWIKS